MSDLDARLEKLQTLLGQGVKLVDTADDVKQDATPDGETFDGFENSYGMVLSDDWIRDNILPDSKEERQDTAAFAAQERALEAKKAKVFDCSNFCEGQALDKTFKFCPLKVMLTYPERFIGKMNRPRAKPFFTKILEDKVWDFFYLHDPKDPARDPYLLVPSEQFEFLLEEINLELGTCLRIPGGLNTDKFYMQFGDGSTPRPRYLRRSQDETSLDIRPWPSINQADIDGYEAASKEKQLKWRSKMRVVKSGFVPKKGDSQKAAMKKRHRDQMLRNTEGYLGLKGNPEGHDVVFICVDVEAIERAPNPISEIGFAILDMRDIRGIAPGLIGCDWWPMIKCHHLRVWEYAGLRNNRYVKGCPDAFNFGTSTFPRKAKTGEAIMGVLDPYLNDSRNIVIVGHDINQDIKYLGTLGIDLLVLTNLVNPVDTKDIHQAWRDSTQGRGLSSVLSELGITSKNLHNAGNDAYYTLCAMLGIALEHVREEEEKSNAMLNQVD
ncbi:qde-2-interacting protein [Fusarium albosuccineum]|uniref:Qde-2-interacting protein n=1 Tax=Fusarium albosuccineum TaxID=1237068 RepID=A0A8H4LNN8_9HYPO|nr:qde-2-interacting protein [Fusarium albosuccineum]